MKRWLLVLLLTGSVWQSYAQTEEAPVKNYQQSDKALLLARKLWKEGEIIESAKQYRRAYSNGDYSHNILAELAVKKIELGDIRGANVLFDEIISTITNKVNQKSQRSDLIRLMYQKMEYNFRMGDARIALNTALKLVDFMGDDINSTEAGFFDYCYYWGAETAFILDDRQALEQLHTSAKRNKKGKYGELLSFVYLRLLDKDYTAALNRIEQIQDGAGSFGMAKSVAAGLLPQVYANLGDMPKTHEAIKQATKNIMWEKEHFYYLNAVVAVREKAYLQAIDFVNKALKGYKIPITNVMVDPIGVFRHYSTRAEAHEGLGNFVQAKKDYEAALILHSTYEPALNGIARLEARIITDRQKDKTAPVISISEPSVSRGLKVTAADKELMVRGKASDAGGIKSVLINGRPVYSKEGGEFWGSVNIVAGTNKVTVLATDFAGNSGEYTFEVNQQHVTSEIVPVQQVKGRNYAVLIASQNYSDSSIPSLENPIPDAVKLKMVLKNKYNFAEENILTLFNPGRADFQKKFLQINDLLQPEDNLIIFYAGHGIWVETEKKGYWLLTDAERNDVNTWLPNKAVLNMIAEVPSRHTLLITDACFSGSVFKTRSIGADAPAAVREMSEKISRVAITSGNDTEVPDESVFMKYLVKALSENKEKYLSAQKMFINQIIEAVMEESKTEPRYGTLESAGHVGGDYIFTKN